MSDELKDGFEEEELFEEETEEDLHLDTISENDRRLITMAYDFIVRSLKDQIADETIIVDQTWQRKYVWDNVKASRLIESLVLNVPIPVCYFAEEEKSGQYLVIDGQQRLWSIYRYLNNEFQLRGLHTLGHLNGKRFFELDKKEQRLINTRGLRCIVLTQECHPELRFDVFERLNYGSVPLNPQELRHCMYRGNLNNLLGELSKESNWLQCLNREEPDNRLRDQELILRFFAFHYRLPNYKPALKTFLNEFMRDHKRMSQVQESEFKKLFSKTTQNVWDLFGNKSFRRKIKTKTHLSIDKNINKALFDLQMLLASHLGDQVVDAHVIGKVFDNLMINPEFADLLVRATDHRTRVEQRFSLLHEEFVKNDIIIEPLFAKINSMSS